MQLIVARASARLAILSGRRPLRRAKSGSASRAAPAPPNWFTRARKVRGPIRSLRMRRSQSSLLSSLSRKALPLLPDPALGAGHEAGDVGPVLEPQDDGEQADKQRRIAPPKPPKRERGDRRRDQRR